MTNLILLNCSINTAANEAKRERHHEYAFQRRDYFLSQSSTFMGLTKRIPAEGGSGGGRGHSAMEHWMKTAEIKDAARIVRRKTNKEAVSEGLSECLNSTLKNSELEGEL